MAYNATVLSVMIASPSDVTEERNIIRDAIHQWNDINAKSTKCVLLPVGWETHSAPDLAGRAQDIINKTVLEHCDLLVGVFWTRLGTPTGDAESGTVEEIKRHISEGKPAMVYFSTAPVALETHDPQQFAALQEFKKWCYNHGLVQTYNSVSNFSEIFRRQIQIKIQHHPELLKNASHGKVNFRENYLVAWPPDALERLTEEAKRLLIEAAKDPDGTIMNIRSIGSHDIQTNGINFTDSKDRRSIARWEAALEQLRSEDLIVERGHKGEIFEITAKGYEVAEQVLPASS